MNSPVHYKTIAIFASGQGTNAQKIIDYFRNHPAIKPGLIICNKPDAGVLQIARKENIPAIIIEKEKFEQSGYLEEMKRYNIDFIVLAGFLWKIPPILIRRFPMRIINIHPALLPSYGGKGMYGMRVHKAILDAKEKKSGITIHFVDEKYDHGNIILQKSLEISEGETYESLAEKIHHLEHHYFAPTIERVLLNSTSETEDVTD